MCVCVYIYIYIYIYISVAQQPVAAQGLLIIEALLRHPHAVGLLWTSKQPDLDTSYCQQLTFTRDRPVYPGGISFVHSKLSYVTVTPVLLCAVPYLLFRSRSSRHVHFPFLSGCIIVDVVIGVRYY